ncbi:MAG: extracellular solute-binding protein [Oscillospiraceae bacterium]|nr:extracellular solute-binding protein [Oscillospiraceae bacterium]
MKKIIAMLLALVMVLSLAACGGASTTEPTKAPTNEPAATPTEGKTEEAANPLAGTYDITVWVSESDGMTALTQEMIDAFEAAYPGIVINASIEGVSEADAGSKVTADVASAPDIYCFAQDQLARLVQAAALAAPSGDIAEALKTANDQVSLNSASVGGTLYAYPMTSDNGFYMYYDTSLFTEEDVESLEKIIEICEANNVKIRYALENAWYNAGFFFATGCHSQWSVAADGKTFTAVDDDFNSEAGLIAMKAMEKLAKSPAYDSNADIFTDAGVVVTGIWNANPAAEHFGENLGATDLPSFEIDGTSYHINSYAGTKLMGVKPQAETNRAVVLSLLAQFLTNEENQLKRYELAQWGPSNLAAQTNDTVVNEKAGTTVMGNISLQALAKQNEYSVIQGQINGSWWDIAKVLGADAKNATSEDDLKNALVTYENAINALLTKSEEELKAWSVIGGICGTSWDTDFPMTETETAGTYLSEALELKAGEEFKVRQGGSWDVNFGVEFNGANIVVEADGKYQVQLVWDGAQEGTVTLVAAE